MSQVDSVYRFLEKNYQENEPIFLSDVVVPGMKEVSVRQQFGKLTGDGRLKRFDTGIYYLPRESIFKSGGTLSVEKVIRQKYLMDGDKTCGYMCGVGFANRLGLTTQVPAVYEVCSNYATTDYRDTRLGGFRVIVKKPYLEINDQNAYALQFLDLMKEVVEVSELEGSELTERLMAYLKARDMKFDNLKPYLRFYPDKIYKNMYEAGLLYGMAT